MPSAAFPYRPANRSYPNDQPRYLLRIDKSRQFRQADEVAQHYGQLPPFGSRSRCRLGLPVAREKSE